MIHNTQNLFQPYLKHRRISFFLGITKTNSLHVVLLQLIFLKPTSNTTRSRYQVEKQVQYQAQQLEFHCNQNILTIFCSLYNQSPNHKSGNIV